MCAQRERAEAGESRAERERRHRTRETGRGTPGHGTRDSNNIRQQRSRWGQRDIKHNHASQQRRSTAGTAGRRQSTAASSLRARAPREREQLVTAGGIIFTPPCLFCMEVLTRYTGGGDTMRLEFSAPSSHKRWAFPRLALKKRCRHQNDLQ